MNKMDKCGVWTPMWATLLLCCLSLDGCKKTAPKPGEVKDEALLAGRQASSFPAAEEDYFHDMDGGISLTAGEIKGRNTWLVWTGGDDRLWDKLSVSSVGALDFLKTLSSYPGLKASRDNRWHWLGLVNEPCFEKATGPDPKRFNLWLDKRIVSAGCPPDPFENESKYPGVALGARGKTVPIGSYYGWASGVVGLRLFPNPDFDEKAAAHWDAEKYYKDRSYYASKDLIKPYRVGMSCAFCHVGPNPLKPPDDSEHPKWENLSSNVGAQYFWVDRIFDWNPDDSDFIYQYFHASYPGTIDTSLVSSDNINNPRTMNAVYAVRPRLERSLLSGKETIAGGERNNRQFNDYIKPDDPQLGWLTKFFKTPDTVWTPRVLKDGSDSVGALGALNRVYLNIGLFSEEWLLHFNVLVGGKPITPIEISIAQKNSTYWLATEAQTVDMALFFLKSTDPHMLKDAPGSQPYLPNFAKLQRGKIVFADYCARCHSSKLPPIPAAVRDPGNCEAKNYLDCWDSYWRWTKTPDFKKAMEKIVLRPDFIDGNFLASEYRVPVTLLETNACSPLATNAIRNNVWDNFASETYKDLPSVGSLTYYHPITGEAKTYTMPGGGRGFTRPASLISVWSTAPFLLNNSVGKFDAEPSVSARMDSFQNSIEQMLWPEKREKDPVIGTKLLSDNGMPLPSAIARTNTATYLRVANGYLPDILQKLIDPSERLFPWLIHDDEIQIGPIPSGTPVNLLASLDILGEPANQEEKTNRDRKVIELLLEIKRALKALPANATDEQARHVFTDPQRNLVNRLIELSKCPDYIVNRGHYFGTSYLKEERGQALSDDDKRALIDYLKTF